MTADPANESTAAAPPPRLDRTARQAVVYSVAKPTADERGDAPLIVPPGPGGRLGSIRITASQANTARAIVRAAMRRPRRTPRWLAWLTERWPGGRADEVLAPGEPTLLVPVPAAARHDPAANEHLLCAIVDAAVRSADSDPAPATAEGNTDGTEESESTGELSAPVSAGLAAMRRDVEGERPDDERPNGDRPDDRPDDGRPDDGRLGVPLNWRDGLWRWANGEPIEGEPAIAVQEIILAIELHDAGPTIARDVEPAVDGPRGRQAVIIRRRLEPDPRGTGDEAADELVDELHLTEDAAAARVRDHAARSHASRQRVWHEILGVAHIPRGGPNDAEDGNEDGNADEDEADDRSDNRGDGADQDESEAGRDTDDRLTDDDRELAEGRMRLAALTSFARTLRETPETEALEDAAEARDPQLHQRCLGELPQADLDGMAGLLADWAGGRDPSQHLGWALAARARDPWARNELLLTGVRRTLGLPPPAPAERVERKTGTTGADGDTPEDGVNRAADEAQSRRALADMERRRHWTPAWTAAAETDDEPQREGEGQRFERQKYLQGLPQPSDRPERPHRTRAELRASLDEALLGLDGPKDAVLDHLCYRLRAERQTQTADPDRASGTQRTGPAAADQARDRARDRAGQRPLCLIGPPGCGKTSLALAIADALQRPQHTVHASRTTAGIDILGADRKWFAPEVGQPIQAALALGVPDGVIIWDDADASPSRAGHMPSGGPAGAALARLLDPTAQADWTDALLGLPYDMRGFVQIVTATHVGELEPSLRQAVTLVHMHTPTRAKMLEIGSGRIVPELRQAVGAAQGRLQIPAATVEHIIRRHCPPGDLSALRARLQRCLAAQLDANPATITAADADRALQALGREAHWSAAWQRRLAEADREQAELRDYLQELPQAPDVGRPEDIELERAAKLMDESHYGLQRVKNEILDHLATIQRTGTTRPRPLALIGPPGTGKTTLIDAIARAMGRPLARISLGGGSGEHVLRGWRGGPGRILQAFRDHGRADPIILLDELDKLAANSDLGVHGPALEVLDPAQNQSFTDEFLRLPYDIGRAWFIATGNDRKALPAELQDRLQIIELPDYTDAEKAEIVRRHAGPKALRSVGTDPKQWGFTDDAIQAILQRQRHGTGMRGVTEDLVRLVQRRAREAERGRITAADVARILGDDDAHSTPIGFAR